ncbi:hypothetical protein BD324DRAFT_439582 [Kockovaella imperatae]|uniref:Uncharacterized protein n=1 Tax=Kockovaella imperatae TaxID=4999 RepID=A0A1Y1UJJ2_9TREE|nr:hypothetical protein BD324DRAFT_439582 [Kockovaella imperatae]ORX37295.1 hypothetical protein BD324DRAFT_439582 [Kockovaella imperatae]
MYPDDSPYADDMKESISTGAGHEVDQAEMVSDFDFDHTAGEDGQWAGYEMSEDENHESWRETIPVFSDEEAEHGAHRTDHGVSVHGAHEAALRGVDESDKMRPEVKTKSANRRPKDNTPFMISASSLEDEDESLDSGELEVDEPDQDPFLGGEDDERYWEQVDVADETTADEQENWKN